ncbi:MAG: GYD domain-containing protein [Chromatiales bacterium]|nr:GYD domain-containing protein [Rhodospirillales bacterium]MDH3918922.1 GYD domain-containing protein [Rhodospirillales bacterium]MDH3947249.1 GYD domain-containing protein [Chromatiales bacterium]MDH3969189.1 GYD domain-containing protein [Rhodospirillales bacterium]
MSTYIMLINYTEQGIRNIKSSPKRADAARFLAKSCGAEMKDLYLTMGMYDLVATVEAPNDEAVAKFALAIGSIGNVRSTTLKAFTEQEYRNIIETLP